MTPARARRCRRAVTALALALGVGLAHAQGPGSPRERNAALFDYLLAEVAAQRGDSEAAVSTLVRLAREGRDPKIARRAVELAIRARTLDPALRAGIALAELEPDAALGRELVSQLIASGNDLPTATVKLSRLIGESADKPRVVMQLVHFLSRFPDKSAVLQSTRTVVSRYPDLPESRYAIAMAAALAGDDGLARRASLEALEQRQGWQQAAILHAQILRKSSPGDAIAFYRGFLQAHPASRDVQLQLGRELAATRQVAPARDAFRAAEALDPNDAEIPYMLGLLAIQAEDFADADAALQRALAKGYGDTDAVQLALGQVAEAAKRWDDALTWYGKVEGERIKAEARAASIIARRDGLQPARDRLHALSPATPQEKVLLVQAEAQLLREAKAWQETFDLLSAAIEREPDTVELLYDRAMVAERVNRLDLLESDLRRVIELKPDYAHAYNALGYTYADRNVRIDEAYALIARAVALAPGDPFILDSLGWVEYRRGNLPEAAKHLRSAYDARPDPEIAAHLGEVLWKLGDREEARRVWRASLADHPEHEALRAVIQKFEP